MVSASPALTGGEQGQTLNAAVVPAALSGIRNTANLYWLALGYLVLCAAVVWWLTTSVPGRMMRAVKENQQRVEVLGLNPYLFKLLAFVVAGVLATGGGVVYLLLLGGATPTVAKSDFTLGLLVMVVRLVEWGVGGALSPGECCTHMPTNRSPGFPVPPLSPRSPVCCAGRSSSHSFC